MAALTAEEQAKIAKQIEEQNKLLDAQITKEEALKDLQGERLRQIDKEIESTGKQVEYAQERLDATAQALQIAKEHGVEENKLTLDRLKAEMKLHETATGSNKISQEELATKQKTLKMMEGLLSLTEEELEHARELAEIEKEKFKTQNKQKKAAKEIGEAMKDMVSSSTGISDAWKTRDGLAGSFTRSIEAGGSLSQTIGELGNGIKNALNPTNFLASAFLGVVDSTKELFFEMDTVLAEFKRGTGLSKEYSDSLLDVRQNQVHLGYGMREIAEQFGDLTAANSAFVFQNKATRVSLQNNAAAMGMAFDASTEFAEAVGFATTALGQAPAAAAKTTRGLATFAKAIKASPKEMMRDYAALAPSLAAWGAKATQVFKETAAAAKALNMETGEMLDIAGQFDTFEGAADQVGQLNAILGGDYFDTVEMVNASESERIELLMEGVRATGKSWDSLGRFERKAIASAAGITDMSQANKMFGQGLDVYKELKSHTDDAAMSYNDLSSAAKENMSIQEKQAAIYKALAISMSPFLDLANSILGIIQSIAQATGALFPYLTIGAALIGKLAWATWGATAAGAAWLAVKNSNLVVSAWMYSVIAAETVATWAAVAGKGALTIATGIASGAMLAFGTAANFALLGIPALIGLIVAAIAGIVYYWDEWTGALTESGLWMDALIVGISTFAAIALSPFTALIGAAALIIKYWTPISQMLESIKEHLSDIGSWINPFSDAGTEMEVAANAEGSTNFTGTSMVGEKGPEIITTKNANIISNENIVRLIGTNERLTTSAAAARTSQIQSPIDIISDMWSNFAAMPASGAPGTQGQQTSTAPQAPRPMQEVILEIDGRKFGKLVIDPYLEGRLQPKMTV